MWPNLHFPADLVTFSEEMLNGKLHFLWSEIFHVLRDRRQISFVAMSEFEQIN